MTDNNKLILNRLDHITLVVADIEASRKFYVDLLGLEEVQRPAFDFPGAWFQCGSTEIHVTLADENSGLPGWADRNVNRLTRGHHFAFEVNDIFATVEYFNNAGIKIESGPKQRPDGPTQIFVFDPDQHLIELFSTTSPAEMGTS